MRTYMLVYTEKGQLRRRHKSSTNPALISNTKQPWLWQTFGAKSRRQINFWGPPDRLIASFVAVLVLEVYRQIKSFRSLWMALVWKAQFARVSKQGEANVTTFGSLEAPRRQRRPAAGQGTFDYVIEPINWGGKVRVPVGLKVETTTPATERHWSATGAPGAVTCQMRIGGRRRRRL